MSGNDDLVKHFRDAEHAIYRVYGMVQGGNEAAVGALRDIAKLAIQLIDLQWIESTLEWQGESERVPEVRKAVEKMIHGSDEWPVMLSSIHEVRKRQLEEFTKLELGAELPLRAGGEGRGKVRKLDRDSPAGFAFDLYQNVAGYRAHMWSPGRMEQALAGSLISQELRDRLVNGLPWERLARDLPELPGDHKVQKLWVDAMVELARDMAEGNLETGRYPEFIHRRARHFMDHGSKVKPLEQAVREACERGLESLLPK